MRNIHKDAREVELLVAASQDANLRGHSGNQGAAPQGTANSMQIQGSLSQHTLCLLSHHVY